MTVGECNKYIEDVYEAVEKEVRQLCFEYNVGFISFSDNTLTDITERFIDIYGDAEIIPGRFEIIRIILEIVDEIK